MVSAIVLAAGKGSRMKSDKAKQFVDINSKPLLYYSLKVFDASVVDEIVRLRKAKPEIPLADYPQTLLVVSDMQFNPSGSYWYSRKGTDEMSNIEAAKTKLRTVFPDEFVDNFKFIWWDVTSRETSDVPSTLDDKSSYFFSGFDGSIVSFLLGGDGFVDKETGEKRIPTAEEVIDIALNQEVMQMVR